MKYRLHSKPKIYSRIKLTFNHNDRFSNTVRRVCVILYQAKFVLESEKKTFRLFSVPEPYLIFGNRFYVRRMTIDGRNMTRIPQLHAFVHIIDIDDKVNRRLRRITNFSAKLALSR